MENQKHDSFNSSYNLKTVSSANISGISLGGGAFGKAYNDVTKLDTIGIIRYAFKLGINAIDTSPFYTTSETSIGNALSILNKEYPRENYILTTKCGRYGTKVQDFDFSSKRIEKSIHESCLKLNTNYLDIVFCHDVEFKSIQDIIGINGALDGLFQLKNQGIIRYVGISGYPLDILLSIAEEAQNQNRPLDAIMSYSHYCFHCTTLLDYEIKFRKCGIKFIFNASPLSMGLLRKEGPQIWHPAPEKLKLSVKECIKICQDLNVDFTQMCLEFSMKNNSFQSLVIGFSSIYEVQQAMDVWRGKSNKKESSYIEAFEKCEKVMQPWRTYEWKSPPEVKVKKIQGN